MKNVILLLFVVMISQTTYSQKPESSDSIYSALLGIKKSLEEKNYTRIPNQDFDKALEVKLSEKVNAEVADRIDTIRNIVFLVLGLIGGALLLGLRTLVKNNVEDQLKEKIKQVDDDLKEKMKLYDEDMKEKIKMFYLEFMKDDMRKELNVQKEELRKEITGYRDEFRKEIDPVKQKSQSIELELNTSKRLLLEYKIDKMKTEKAPTNNYNKQDLELAKEYLAQAEELKDKRLVALALTELSIAAYYTKSERDIESVIDKYMDATDMDINENVFINLAGGMFYEYAATRDKTLRTKGMKYINASLRKIRDYGEAHGLKLEFLMADYEEAFEEAEKEKIKHEASIILKQILESAICAKETIGRYTRVKPNPTEKKYIDLLYQLFPDELKKMEEMANPNV